MKKYLLATIIAFTASSAMAPNAFAGGSDRSDSSASSQALAAANSASQSISVAQGGGGGFAQGGNVTFNTPANTNSRSHITTDGTQTIKSAPQVVPPSMSSGHPCAFAPVSVGISVIGFGGAIGGQRIDDACLLAQMGVADASISMIAARNPSACRALEAVGRIRSGSCGNGRASAAPVAYRTAVTPAPRRVVQQTTVRPARTAFVPYPNTKLSTKVSGNTTLVNIPRGSVKCVRNQSGKVVRVERWARVPVDVARKFCKG